MASAPTTSVATTAITLEAPTGIGDITPCLDSGSGSNVFYADYVGISTWQTGSNDTWTELLTPDQIEISAADPVTPFSGTFSSVELAEPLAVGNYENAESTDNATVGHPGMYLNVAGPAAISTGDFRSTTTRPTP